MRSTTLAALAASAALCPTLIAGSDTIDPRGVYYHTFTGPFSGTEWIHIWDLDGDNRYQFSDIRGVAPYDGQITPDGTITWDTLPSQSGNGMFTDQNNASQFLVYQGGTYLSTMRRAPGTDASFITRIDSREDGDAMAAGQWNVQIDTLDASTGDLLMSETTLVTTTVTGDLLRLDQADGTFYQGVFETGTTAGFRVLTQGVSASEYASFDGSAMSWNQNMMGDFRMTGDDSFAATFLLSTRRQPATQTQTVYRMTGARVPAPGSVGLAVLAATAWARRRR